MSSTIRWEQDADGIVVLTLDDPSSSANTMNDAYVQSMAETVDRLEAEKDTGFDHEQVNVNGGAIAMGHPLGATGAMILGSLVDELERRDLRYGLATLCVGGGMGIATVVERV